MGLWADLRCLIAMGICLDTGHRREPLPLDDLHEDISSTPVVRSDSDRPIRSIVANSSLLSHQDPASAAVVIFFLGGPGSGKVAHAQNLADLHVGYRHINMVIIMSEYVKENALGPPENLSPAVALALLAREFQNSSQCRALLVTGYPRHLGDLQLYNEKLGQPNGAILMEWDKRALLRNIELGRLDGAILLEYQEVCDDDCDEANLGYMVAEAARRELSDFYAKVLPVCEHLDNLGTLYVVSGERTQEEIFRDVQKAHAHILRPNLTHPPSRTSIGSYREFRQMVPFAVLNDVVQEATEPKPINPDDLANNNLPPCLFLMGGPGSNKGTLLRDMMYLYPGWGSFNVGTTLRSRVTAWRTGLKCPEGLPSDKLELIENLLAKGDLVPQDLIMEILSHKIEELSDKEGIIIVGFPRDVIQAQAFEEKFGHVPPLILLDCSELELGRSLGRRETRIDDNVAAAHRRLNIYRQVTLPMLKAFDEKNRLRIIDGDADIDQVTKELKRAIYVETKMLMKKRSRSAQHLLVRKTTKIPPDEENDSFSDQFSDDEKADST